MLNVLCKPIDNYFPKNKWILDFGDFCQMFYNLNIVLVFLLYKLDNLTKREME